LADQNTRVQLILSFSANAIPMQAITIDVPRGDHASEEVASNSAQSQGLELIQHYGY
jgi:hypothetical protein